MATADPADTPTTDDAATTTTTTTKISNETDNKIDYTDEKEQSPTRNDNLKEFESKLPENEKIRKYSKAGGGGGGNNGNENKTSSNENKMGRQSSAPNIKTRVSFGNGSATEKKADEPPTSIITNINPNDNSDEGFNSSPENGTSNNNDNNRDPNDPKLLALERATSMPPIAYDPCREFDSFAGDWVDSKGQPVIISAWGVIRYPNNPKLRFEAIHMGPNHLSVTFDRDPKKRKFVGKLNHDCNTLIWSNDTKWTRKGTKGHSRKSSKENIPAAKTPSISNNNSQSGNESDGSNSSNNSTPKGGVSRNGSCIVM